MTALYFVDPSVSDYSSLAAGFGPDAEVVVLQAGQDGLRQIADWLTAHAVSGLDALHIFSEGAPGTLVLGNAAVTAETLAQQAALLATIGQSLSATADILLYGCAIGQGALGQAFIDALAQWTGADVAASTDATGAAALGGNWALEAHSGSIEATPAELSGYAGLLAAKTASYADTAAANTFAAATGSLSGNGGDTVTGGISTSGTSPGGFAYTDYKIGVYGTLYVKDGSASGMGSAGSYRYEPNNAAINALSSGGATDVFTINYAGGGMMGGGTGSDTLTVTVTGVNDTPILDAGKSPALLAQNADLGAPAGAVGTLVSTLVEFSSAGGMAQTGGLDNVVDADSGAQLGVALTAVDASNGNWFYSTNNGVNWTAVGAVSATSALLLAADANTRLYFQSNSGYTGTVASAVTFKAWDQFAGSGTAGSKANPTATAFSAVSDTASITIVPASNHAPTLDAPPAIGYTDTSATDSFANRGGVLAGSDADAGQTLSYGIASGATGGATVVNGVTYDVSKAGADGTLYVKSASGDYVFVPNATAINALAGNAADSYTVTVTDGFLTTTNTLAVNLAGVNDSPVLDTSKSPALSNQTINAGAPSGAVGSLVSSLVDLTSPAGQVDNVTDADSGALPGIALTAVNASNGAWYYSINGGANWTAVGAVSAANALLLAADASTRLYFQPGSGYIGTVSEGISFKAWDQTAGTAGGKVDSGTGTAFSAATDTASVTVAPTGIYTIYTDTAAADSFANWSGSISGSGTDTITGGTASAGTSPGGFAYTDYKVGAYGTLYVKDGSSSMMGSAGSYRYEPNAAAIQALSSGGASESFAVGYSGGMMSGSGSDTLQVFVTGANDAPILDASKSPALPNQTANLGAPVGAAGTPVASLVDFSSQAGGLDNVGDADAGAQPGIAVIGVDASHGVWFYSTDGGANWLAVGAVSSASALLLPADANTRLYFQSDNGYTGTVASGVSFKAWDLTVGTAGGKTDTGGSSAFSSATDTAAITIVPAANHAPALDAPAPVGYADTAAADSFANTSGQLSGHDQDSGQTLSYGITGGATGASTVIGGVVYNVSKAGNDGTLYVNSATGGYVFVPDAAAINALSAAAVDSYAVTVSDGYLTSADTLAVNLAGVNDAPVLDAAQSPAFSATYNGAAPSGAVGALVSSLVDFASPAGQVDNVTDADSGALPGVALTAADSAHGTWFYSTNGGGAWTAVGAVSSSSALLLAADANTRVYFQPATGYIGSADLTFKAWDQTSGVAGAIADTGVGSAFSSAADTASAAVAPTGVYTIYTDTSAVDSFANWSGTLPSAGSDAISGGVSSAGTVNGFSYTDYKAGVYGTLYVADGSAGGMMMGGATKGGYLYVPNSDAINTLGAGAFGQDLFTVNWSQSGMMGGGSSGSDTLSVYVVGADEANTAPVLAQPTAISIADTAAWDKLAFAPANPSFETADTSGWAVAQGSANAVFFHSGGADNYFATDGDYFLVLEPGAADVYTTASQVLSVQAGQAVSGQAAFDSEDAAPDSDNAYVKIFDAAGHLVATPWSAGVLTLGAFVDTPWTAWQWTPTAAGNYRVEYGLANGGNAQYPSYALFDQLALAADPSSLGVSAGSLAAADAQNDVLSYGIQGVAPVDGIASQASAYGVLAVDTATGGYTFTPDAAAVNALPAGSSASARFTVTVSDGALSDSKTLTVNLAGANDTPVGAATAQLPLGGENTTYPLHAADLLQGFSDADTGDTLAVAGLSANHGMLVDHGGGDWTFTPATGYHGAVALAYTVIDGHGGSVAATESFNLAAAPTLAVPAAPVGIQYGTPLSLSLAAGSNADGNLSFAATRADGSPLPAWLAVNPATGALSGTPSADDLATFDVKATATNAAGQSVSGEFHLSVAGFDLGQFIMAGTGNPVLAGGAGVDTACFYEAIAPVNVSLASSAAQNTGGAGWLALANIDNLIGGSFNDHLAGNAGGNVLDGGGGADWLACAAGNDTYVVANANEQVVESAGEGTDLVMSLTDYTLPANVEKLTLLGSANLDGSGNSLNNTLAGNVGGNVLDGGTGADSMAGGAGDDTYIVDNPLDQVVEPANQGVDLVRASISYTLPANVENLTLLGAASLNGTGNGLDNTLIGNGGANKLNGGGGNDTLAGGAGADHFQFTTAPNAAANLDTITDFAPGEDKIDLSKTVFTAFAGLAAGGSLANAEMGNHLLYNAGTGVLAYDADGSAGAGVAVAFAVLGVGSHPAALAGADFWVAA